MSKKSLLVIAYITPRIPLDLIEPNFMTIQPKGEWLKVVWVNEYHLILIVLSRDLNINLMSVYGTLFVNSRVKLSIFSWNMIQIFLRPELYFELFIQWILLLLNNIDIIWFPFCSVINNTCLCSSIAVKIFILYKNHKFPNQKRQ